MKIYNMLSSQIRVIILIAVTSILFSCEEKPKTIINDNVVAKVNNSILTKEAFNNFTSSEKYSHKFGREIINEWIEKELLFNKANEEGITNTAEYIELLNKSKRELASAIYLQKYFDNNLKQVTESEILSYFIQNKEDFRLKDDAVIVNQIKFNSLEIAKEFRDKAVSSSWIRAVNLYFNKAIQGTLKKNVLLFRYQINPLRLLKSLEQLNVEEITNVVETSKNEFTVFQLIEKLKVGTVPDFSICKADVSKRYYAKLKKDLYKKLIDQLSKEYEVEINEENIK